VVCTHRGAYLNALSVALELRMGPDSVYLWTLPMFHCNGWCCTWGVTAVGATHVSLRKVEPAVVWSLVERERVTHFCAAPTVVVALANDPSAKPQSRSQPVRLATGGAPPSPTTVAQMAALGLEVIHLYGMTETYGPSISCAWWPEWDDLLPEQQAEIKARQGVPHPGVGNARIVDADLREVPSDGATMGELVIREQIGVQEVALVGTGVNQVLELLVPSVECVLANLRVAQPRTPTMSAIGRHVIGDAQKRLAPRAVRCVTAGTPQTEAASCRQIGGAASVQHVEQQ
jgi:acyl-CoA synthetase (AMP-forming)/AMP-acid ligase II